MSYRSIRIGQISSHPVVAFAVQELRRYLKKMDPQLVVEICRCEGIMDDLGDLIWVGVDPRLEGYVPKVESRNWMMRSPYPLPAKAATLQAQTIAVSCLLPIAF